MRTAVALGLLLIAAASAQAHFIWLVPADDGSALMIFSDTLEPDANVPVKKIVQTKLFARGGVNGEAVPLKIAEAQDAYRVSLAKPATGPVIVGGVCQYGVLSKGKADPFLVMYYPKAVLWQSAVKERPELLFTGISQLPLEIVGVLGGKPRGKVLWHGKPAAGVEVVLSYPGAKEPVEVKTDADGMFELGVPLKSGLCAGRAKLVEAKAGELDGKQYKEIRHYATMTFELRAAKPAPPKAGSGVLP